ncbi:MAG TPA: MG2 domain-containing protein, partial [Burkholderiales bacterium]|nr:MG2 domain-containing protein [Burkholderiales bacterium]
RKDFVDRFLYALLKDGRLAGIVERDLLRGTGTDKLRTADPAKLPLVLLRCARRLPAESPLRLVWGKGIESSSGVSTGLDQVLEFTVRPAFAASFSCQRVNPDAGCLPFVPMQLGFSAPIARASAQKIVLRGPQKTYKPTLPDPSQAGDWIGELSFDAPFPEQAVFKLEIPADLRDDAGRRLANYKRFPLTVKTDAAPPLAKFPARFGIIESKGDATLPVTLRNLEAQVTGRVWSAAQADAVPGGVLRIGTADARSVVEWLRRVRDHAEAEWIEAEEGEPGGRVYAAERSILAGEQRVRAIKVPKPAGARAFEVVGIPLRQPGFYVVELASPKLGAALLTGSHPKATGGEVYHVSTSALVTNLAVHFKHGRESSLVWVTALDSGVPVAKAQVSVQDCSGKEHAKAVTDARGLARVPIQLPARDRLPGCLSDYDRQYMVFARLGADVSFVMSDWDEGISRWRFNLPQGGWQGPFIATTVLDRTLVRAGETVHMKHFYRQHMRGGLRLIAGNALPTEVIIEHQGSEQRYKLPVKWDARNSAVSDWQVPRDAKTGVYGIVFEDKLNGRPARRNAGTFRVEEFRVPLMRASIDPPAAPLVNPERVEIGVQVSYLAGGGAANAPVKVRSVVQPRSVRFAGYEEFTLGAGAVQEGLQEERGRPWYRGDYLLSDSEGELPAGVDGGPATKPLETQSLTLDNGGGGKLTLAGIPSRPTPQEIVTELEYTDPNGEVLTTSARIPVWPAAVVLGLKPDSWALSKDNIKFQALALDLDGKPLPGVRVALALFERRTFSHRKRLLGGFYAYESGAEVKRVKDVCEGTTDAKGLLFCEFASPVSGEVLIEARARDAAGNPAATHSSAWVAGSGEWWFDVSNDDRMDVLPERKRYEPGDKAVFQVRMPFRKAKALVTVEREGVMDAFVLELSGKAPVVEVPVRWNHAPNVFVSVLAVRGRVGGVQPTALVDLGKPAFKMGVA